MHHLAIKRGKAYARDCVVYAGFAAAMLPLGLVLQATGRAPSRRLVTALSMVPPAAATLFAAARESRDGATPGKKAEGLRVSTDDGQRVGWGTALLRNVVKIGIPWQIGHEVAIGAASGGFERGDRRTLAATIVTYPLLGALVGSVLVGSGRGVHDRLAGTRVAATRGRS
ncbi:RDD family protein [Paramicrobacterium humi]|uniref:RDD family protein n=1 Tax=Paramicrobacterium humi TaxID=640635 RepID=A0A1H4IY82_9MICO|nr:RDD family protein [Microbacterium humi]SEB39021.1 RDD family protein [Microbacterium humi]